MAEWDPPELPVQVMVMFSPGACPASTVLRSAPLAIVTPSMAVMVSPLRSPASAAGVPSKTPLIGAPATLTRDDRYPGVVELTWTPRKAG